LVEPLGFTLGDAQLRRAGLDYHDLATVSIHHDLDALWAKVQARRTFAFTASGSVRYDMINYASGDILMFGPEPTGLDAAVLNDERVSERVRIPMLPGRRSLNLANSVALAVYEAWRQQGFRGALV
jgi:tRNA (cytidine/uridine-2'-O-)-methyltransferase